MRLRTSSPRPSLSLSIVLETRPGRAARPLGGCTGSRRAFWRTSGDVACGNLWPTPASMPAHCSKRATSSVLSLKSKRPPPHRWCTASLQELPQRQREILLLVGTDELGSSAGGAEILRITPIAFRVRLARARRALRAALERSLSRSANDSTTGNQLTLEEIVP